MARIRAGAMDRRIVIKTLGGPPDSAGQPADAEQVIAEVWAEVMHVSGGESFAADQRTAKQVASFRIRYRAGISPSMVIDYEGSRYDIRDVDDTNRREGELLLLVDAKEVISGQG